MVSARSSILTLRIYDETTSTAIKRVLARQVEAAMKEQNVSKAEMAKRMHTSRASLDRLLDPDNDGCDAQHVAEGRYCRGPRDPS